MECVSLLISQGASLWYAKKVITHSVHINQNSIKYSVVVHNFFLGVSNILVVHRCDLYLQKIFFSISNITVAVS